MKTRNCDVGSVPPLSLHTVADSTNIDNKVRIGSSFNCVGKATVVSACNTIASRGIIDLQDDGFAVIKTIMTIRANLLTVNFVLLVKAALTVTIYFGPGL